MTETETKKKKEEIENEIFQLLLEKFDGWQVCKIIDFLINSLHYFVSTTNMPAPMKAALFNEESKYFRYLADKIGFSESEVDERKRVERTQVREVE